MEQATGLKALMAIANKEEAREQKSQEETTIIKVRKIKGYSIETTETKPTETFRINPSYKRKVERIVKASQSKGQKKLSKGSIYNQLIKIGLDTLKGS